MCRFTQLFIPSHPFEWKDGPFWVWLKTSLTNYHLWLCDPITSHYLISHHITSCQTISIIYDITGVVSRNWNPQLSKPPLGRELPWRLGVKNAQDGNWPYTFCKISVMAAWNQMQWRQGHPEQNGIRDDKGWFARMICHVQLDLMVFSMGCSIAHHYCMLYMLDHWRIWSGRRLGGGV